MGVQFALLIILYISGFGVLNTLKQVPQEINAKLFNNYSTEIFKPANTTPLSIKYLTSSESINKIEKLEDLEEKPINVNKCKNITKRNGPRKRKSEFNDYPEYLFNEGNIPIDGAIDRSLSVFGSVKSDEYTFKPVRRKFDRKHNMQIELYEGIDNEQTEFPTGSTEMKSKVNLNGNDDKQPTTASTTIATEQNESSKIKELTYDDIRADNLDDTLSDMTNIGKIELKSMKAKYDEDKKMPTNSTIPPASDAVSQIMPTRYIGTYYDILPNHKEKFEDSTRVNHSTESTTEIVLVYFTVPTYTFPFDNNATSLLDSSNRERSQNMSHLDFGLDKNEDETDKIIGVDDTQTEQNEDIKSTEITAEIDDQHSSEDGGKITPKTAKLNFVETHYYDDDDNDNKDYDVTLNDVTTSSATTTTTPTTTKKHIHKKHKGKEYHKQPFHLHPFSKKINAQKLLEDEENLQLTFDEGFKHQFSDIRASNLEKKLEKYIKMSPNHNYYNTKSMEAIFTPGTPSIHTTHKNKKNNIAKNGHTGHKAKIPSVRKDNINRNKNNRYTTKGTTLRVGKMNLIQGRRNDNINRNKNNRYTTKATTLRVGKMNLIQGRRNDNINRNKNNRYTTKGTTLRVGKMNLIQGRRNDNINRNKNNRYTTKATTLRVGKFNLIQGRRKDNINRNKNNRYTTKGTTLRVGKMNLIQGSKLGSKTTTFYTPDAAQETTASSLDIRKDLGKDLGKEHSTFSMMRNIHDITSHAVQSSTQKVTVNKLNSTLKLKASMNKLLSWKLPNHTFSASNHNNEVTADYQTIFNVEAVTSPYNKNITTISPWYKKIQNNKTMHYNVLPLRMQTNIETSSKSYEHYKNVTFGTLPSRMRTNKNNNISITPLNKSSQALQKIDNITDYKAKTPKIKTNKGFLLQTKVTHGVKVNEGDENVVSVTKSKAVTGASSKNIENTFTIDEAKLKSINSNSTMKVSIENITTQSMTDKILNKLLKVNPIIEKQMSSSIQDRNKYVNKTSSLYRTLVQITLKELLDKLTNTSYKKNADNEKDSRGKDFKDDYNIIDLIFSKTFLKGVFSTSNLYNTVENTTLPPKDSYLNSNLKKNADIQLVSDIDRTNIIDNESVFSDPEMHEYKSKAKTLVENILNIILNDALSSSPDKMKQKQLRNILAFKHDVVNRVLKVLNNKTKERVLSLKESQVSETALSNDIFNVTKNTVVPTRSTTKRNVAKLYTVTFEEVLPLAIDYTQTSTSNAVTTTSMTTDQETQVTTSIVDERTTETIDKDQNNYYDSINTTDIVKSTITISNEKLIRSQLIGLKTNNYIITTTEIHDSTSIEINLNDVTIINDSNGEILSTDQAVTGTKKLKTSTVTKNGAYTTSVFETYSGKAEIDNNINKSNENLWFIQDKNGNLKHSDSFLGYSVPFSSTTSIPAKTLKVKPMIYDNFDTINQGITKDNEKIYDDYENSTKTIFIHSTTAKPTLPLIELTSNKENYEVTENITYLVNIDEVSNITYKNNDSNTFKTGELSEIALNSFIGGDNVKNEGKNDIKLQTNITKVLVTDKQHQRFISKDQINVPDTIFEDETVTLSSIEMYWSEDSIEETMSSNDPINFLQIESSTPISHTSRYFYPESESSQQEILKEAKVMPLKYNITTSIDNNWNFGNIAKPPFKRLKEVTVEGYTEVTNKIKNADNLNSAEYTSSKDEDKDLDKVAVALKSYVNDESSRIGPNTGITPLMQDKTLVDVNPEEISEMLYYDLPGNKDNEAVMSTSRSVSNKSSLLTGEILNTLLKELILMNDVAEKKQSVENIKLPIKLNPFDPNLENVIRKLLLNNKIPGLIPKHPEKVAIFEVEGKDKVENDLYPKKVSVYDPDVDKVIQKIKLYHTLSPKKTTNPSKATTQKPIKVQWHEIKNPDGRKSNAQNCPKVHCFLVNDSTDKSKLKIGIIDKLQEIRPIISNSNNSVENLPIDMDVRKSFDEAKLPTKKPITNKMPTYNKNNLDKIQNKSILPTYTPAKSFFYKKPEAVELFPNDLHANSSIIKMKVSDSINVPSSNMCGLENAPFKRVQEGSSNIEKYPWLGVLIYPKGKKHLVTTVVLVTVQLVITSAWEISKLPKDDFRRCSKVILGHSCSGSRIGVLNYNFHPDFRAGFLSSLAVIQIDSENYVHILRPICPPPQQFFSPQFYSMVMPEDCTSSKITIYKMNHVPMDVCRGYYRQHKLVTSRFWPRHCACGKSRWGGVCLWRSGTVLVVKQDQRWHLLGFGVPGPGCEAPSRYIDYSMHSRWIELMLERIGQSAVTRMAPNRLIFRRCLNQIQRFGPCDAEEVRKSLFQESSEFVEPRSSRRERQLSRVQYNLTVWDNIDYHCVVFQAYNVKDTSGNAQPKLEIKRNAPNEDRRNAGTYHANIDFNVTIEFYDSVRYKVLAYGERSKRNNLTVISNHIEDNNNILKTLAEHAENYITKTTQNYDIKKNARQPSWDVNRRYIRRKSLEKYKNSYTPFHNKMDRPRRKTMEQPSRRKAKSRMNKRRKESSEKKKRNIRSKQKKRRQ